jgi:ankyrin repeat protein
VSELKSVSDVVSTTHLQVRGWTSLHLACERGHVEVVTVLVTAGAQVDAQDLVWTVKIRVDLFSSGWLHSPPSCMLSSL